MATYTFNYGVADTVRDEMAQVTITLRNELESMEQQVALAMQDWDDGAKQQYAVAKQQWDAAAARMPYSLAQAEIALNNISGGYLQVEHTGANAWGGYSVK